MIQVKNSVKRSTIDTEEVAHGLSFEIPDILYLFIQGFEAENEQGAKLFFEQAIRSINSNNKLTVRELQSVYAMFRMIDPQDIFEKTWCAQYMVSYLLGKQNLTSQTSRDEALGLRLLKTADEAISRIHKIRENGESVK